MEFIGQIESLSAGIDRDKWISLIDSHESLARVRAKKGINPFTREPCEYKAPASTALLVSEGLEIGRISWAMDDSPILNVEADQSSAGTVVAIAEEIASILAARFVAESS